MAEITCKGPGVWPVVPFPRKGEQRASVVLTDEHAPNGAMGTELPDSHVCGAFDGIDAIRSAYTYISFWILIQTGTAFMAIAIFAFELTQLLFSVVG